MQQRTTRSRPLWAMWRLWLCSTRHRLLSLWSGPIIPLQIMIIMMMPPMMMPPMMMMMLMLIISIMMIMQFVISLFVMYRSADADASSRAVAFAVGLRGHIVCISV